MSSSLSSEKSQYHHFVPRFILKNFAHPYKPPKDLSDGAKKRNRRKRKGAGYSPGDLMLNVVDTGGDTMSILETSVAKTLGMTDMYRDLRGPTNQHHLEEKLSKLEARAGTVISKIRKTFEAGEQQVCITRTERNDLRKFLFIMKYRGCGMHKRYFHFDADEYSENDKENLRRYMDRKEFKSPIHVWFDNINAMLDINMDEEMTWMRKLLENAYETDAAWFVAHCQMMYLALCTPSEHEDEFILTENAYSIFEGPASAYVDPITKKSMEGAWTEFHMFAPISPKLMIVLRSFVFPVPEEDSHEETRLWRRGLHEQMAAQHGGPQNMFSMFESLPISKARNSYTRIINGHTVLLEGESGSRRKDHKFYFPFFPLPKLYTDRLNFVMLDNAFRISTIIYSSRKAFGHTVRAYLTIPCEVDERPCLKLVDGIPGDERLRFLKKLEHLSETLNVGAVATYQNLGSTPVDPLVVLGTRLQTMTVHENFDLCERMQAYCALGGNFILLPKDGDQASKMLNMRIKIDVWSKGLSDSQREDIRQKLGQLFCQLPPRRIWMYLKHVRLMLIHGRQPDKNLEPTDKERELFQKGEACEDVIANVSRLIRQNRIGHLLYFAAINDLLKGLPIGPSGSICDCGIPAIEDAVKSYIISARMTSLQEIINAPMLTDEEKLEIMGRSHARYCFDDLIGDDRGSVDTKALKRVLFEIIYPCPGS